MGAQEFIGVPVLAFIEQVDIKIRNLGRETIGVIGDVGGAFIGLPAQTVTVGDDAGLTAPSIDCSRTCKKDDIEKA